MLWLTWRQHRLQLVTTILVLGTIAAYLIPTSRDVVAFARTFNESCFTDPAAGQSAACEGLFSANRFVGEPTSIKQLLILCNLLPAIVAIFWGAPMIAREFERGTHRLAWTQSVSPARWTAIKLTALMLAAALGGAAASKLFTWALSGWRVTGGISRFRDWYAFDLVGVVPVVLWPLALLLGAAAGLVVRRTSVAMATSLVLFGLLILGMAQLRPHHANPVTMPASMQEQISPSIEAWFIERTIVDRAGRGVSIAKVDSLCPYVPMRSNECLQKQGWQEVIRYHPANRFWRFQWTQAGILATCAALLTGFVMIRIRRRAW